MTPLALGLAAGVNLALTATGGTGPPPPMVEVRHVAQDGMDRAIPDADQFADQEQLEGFRVTEAVAVLAAAVGRAYGDTATLEAVP